MSKFSKAVSDIVHFLEHEKHLLRGIGVNKILAHGAALYANKQGSSSTYSKSKVEDRLTYFISHNWVTGRISKYLTLSIYFNLKYAIPCSLFVVILNPLATMSFSSRWELWCQVTCIPCFFVVMAVASDIKVLLGFEGSSCFVDKACISQSNSDLLRMGVKKLGAFIANSEKMIVIFTDVYLDKLWTVYEVACALIVLGHDRLVVLPVFRTWVLVFTLILHYISPLLGTAVGLQSVGGINALIYNIVKILPITVGFAVLARIWKRKLAFLRISVTLFCVRSAKCASEFDRPFIYANIARLMRAAALVDKDAGEDVALAAFNSHVRRNLMRALDSSLGRRLLTYRECVVIGFMYVIPNYVDSRLGLWKVDTLQIAVTYTINNLGALFVSMPLFAAVIDEIVGYQLHLRGWQEYVYVAVCGVVALFVSVSNLALGVALSHNERFPLAVTCALIVSLYLVMQVVSYRYFFSSRVNGTPMTDSADPRGGRREDERHHDTDATLTAFTSSLHTTKTAPFAFSASEQVRTATDNAEIMDAAVVKCHGLSQVVPG